MAIYNNWSEEIGKEALIQALSEIYADVSEVTVSTADYTIDFGNGNNAKIWGTPTGWRITVAGQAVQISAYNTMELKYRYYAKTNNEVLITSAASNGNDACIQMCIAKTTDGSWGAVCLGRYGTEAYDRLAATGLNASSATYRRATNYGAADINYVSLRRCVKYGDVVFENALINTSGAPSSLLKFDMDGVQYVSASNNTGNNNVLVMKL